jgi:type IV secretion system protein TrbG
MDPRRLRLTAPCRMHLGRLARLALTGGLAATLGACALLDRDRPLVPATVAPSTLAAIAPVPLETPEPAPVDTSRPYLEAAPPEEPVITGREALARANADARAESRSSAFVGGLQVFDWAPGRVYEIWTAPLRVTTLTLPPGETVTALAAGDTVRWQIAESASGEAGGAGGRSHVLIKPLETGLETNLVLTTSSRVYLIHLRSGRAADGFNTAVTWDAPTGGAPAQAAATPRAALTPAGPEGPVHADYRIEPRGRAPVWTPVSVFDDGVRTFVVLPPAARQTETPVLFVLSPNGEPEVANGRQVDGLIIVDRLFERAELRRCDRRPEVVRITREAAR